MRSPNPPQPPPSAHADEVVREEGARKLKGLLSSVRAQQLEERPLIMRAKVILGPETVDAGATLDLTIGEAPDEIPEGEPEGEPEESPGPPSLFARISLSMAQRGMIVEASPISGPLPAGLVYGGGWVDPATALVTLRVGNVTGSAIELDPLTFLVWVKQ